MKPKFILYFAIAVAIIALLLVVFQTIGKDETVLTPENPFLPSDQASKNTVPESGVDTLASLSAIGSDMECAVTYRASDVSEVVEGSYFIADGKIRGDFLQEDESLGQIVTSYIFDGSATYMWSIIDGQSYGVVSGTEVDNSLAVRIPIPADEKVRYTCKEWTVIDGSIFEPPKTVIFKNAVNADMEYGTIYEEGEFGL